MITHLLEEAQKEAAAFLDGGGAHATRLEGPAPDGALYLWRIEAERRVAGVSEIQLSLPEAFPAEAPNIFIVGNAARGLPHIEEHGRVCLTVEMFGSDYDNPNEPILRTLVALEDYLVRCEDAAWVEQEFVREATLYWYRFCKIKRKEAAMLRPIRALSVLDDFKGAQSHKVFALVKSSKRGRSKAYLGGDELPSKLLRHGIETEGFEKADALFIRLPADVVWTAGKWPRDYLQVKALATEHYLAAETFFETCVGKRSLKTSQCKFVLFGTEQGLFAYQIPRSVLPLLELPKAIPLEVNRMDAAWCLTRGDSPKRFIRRQAQRVVVFGAGALGAPTADCLARSGIGRLEIVDMERFAEENISRHQLGMESVGYSKADELADRIRRQVPGIEIRAHAMTAQLWLARVGEGLKEVDLIVDCSGSSSVRALVSRLTKSGDIAKSTIIGWMEPFGAAAHVVSLPAGQRWPDDDPVEAINAAAWPAEAEVYLPGCGKGFHPYGYADALRTASFLVECSLDMLESNQQVSTVNSYVKSREYFAELPVIVEVARWVPGIGAEKNVHLVRELSALV